MHTKPVGRNWPTPLVPSVRLVPFYPLMRPKQAVRQFRPSWAVDLHVTFITDHRGDPRGVFSGHETPARLSAGPSDRQSRVCCLASKGEARPHFGGWGGTWSPG